ncbi:MAG: GAF domain-containing protein [Chloroflexota bacterium]
MNRTMNVRAMLVVPVESRRRRIGTISVQSTTPPSSPADDERLLTVLGCRRALLEKCSAFIARSSERAAWLNSSGTACSSWPAAW